MRCELKIDWLEINGFRNFDKCKINFAEKSLIIGANDVGKTNLIASLRLLLDRSLSDLDLEPCESDFHVNAAGKVSESLSITIKFKDTVEDAVISVLAGRVSDNGEFFLKYEAGRTGLTYRILAGHSLKNLEEVQSRFYLRHLCIKVVDSRRDLQKFIQSEKRHLLKVAQELRSSVEAQEDEKTLSALSSALADVNAQVSKLHYVKKATNDVNDELKTLAHHNSAYSVQLNSISIDVSQFVEKLELAGSTSGAQVLLGGDGRNNQILLALWKAKTSREFDKDNEVVIYCVEEPEAHLHPHQQRKLTSYLTTSLNGSTIVTSHSPQITSGYSPESIIRLKRTTGKTSAASNGCSPCISSAWDGLGYRMSILPAEAFFSAAVFLVEGPSEVLFYRELARRLAIDLDFYNISILAVDGIAFEVYAKILDAMEISFVMRTDNDISDISTGKRSSPEIKRNLAGFNRCLSLSGATKLPHRACPYSQQDSISDGTYASVSKAINPKGIYVSQIDLENDHGIELADEFKKFKGTVVAAVKYLQQSKAVRMREFIFAHGQALSRLGKGNLAAPLHACVELAKKVES